MDMNRYEFDIIIDWYNKNNVTDMSVYQFKMAAYDTLPAKRNCVLFDVLYNGDVNKHYKNFINYLHTDKYTCN